MNTTIISQKFYQDADNNIVCIDIMAINKNTWASEVQDGWTSISKSKALSLLSPSADEIAARLKSEAEDRVAAARARCDHDILPLQDAVDLGHATNKELETLKQLKQFRVALNRWTHPEEIPILVKKG